MYILGALYVLEKQGQLVQHLTALKYVLEWFYQVTALILNQNGNVKIVINL